MEETKVYKPITSTNFNANDDADLINFFNEIGSIRRTMTTKTAVRDTLLKFREPILKFLKKQEKAKAS